MEDVAADQAEDALQIHRRQHLSSQHRLLETRRVLVDRRDHQVGDFVAMVVPAAATGKFRLHLLAEQAGDMLSGRRQRAVQGGGNQHLDDRLARPATRTRIQVGAVHIVQVRRHDDASGQMIPFTRQRSEIRQARQGHVHAQRAGTAAPVGHAFAGRRRHRCWRHQALVQQLRIDVGDHRPRMQGFAGFCEHADGTARLAIDLLYQHLAHARIGADFHPRGNGRLGHCLGDRAHAADGMPPRPFHPIHFAEHVMQQYVGRARRIRTGVVADDAVETQHGLDRRAFEPAIQILARRNGEQIQQFLAQGFVQPMQLFAQAPGTHQLGQRFPPAAIGDVGRRLHGQRAQHIGDGIQAAFVFGQAPGVAPGKLGHLVQSLAAPGQ